MHVSSVLGLAVGFCYLIFVGCWWVGVCRLGGFGAIRLHVVGCVVLVRLIDAGKRCAVLLTAFIVGLLVYRFVWWRGVAFICF